MTEFEINYVEPANMKPRVRVEKISTPITIPDYAIENVSPDYGTIYAWIDYEDNPWVVTHDGMERWTVKTGEKVLRFPYIEFGKPVHEKTKLEECEELIATISSWLEYDIETVVVADDTSYAAEMNGLTNSSDIEYWKTAIQSDIETVEYFIQKIGDFLAGLK